VLLLVIAVIATSRVAGEQSALQRSTRAAVQESSQTSATLISLLNAETGVRGYLVSGDPAFLQPWQSASRTLGGQLHALDAGPELTAATRRSLDLTARVEMTALRQLVASNTSGPLTRRVLTARLLAGKASMDRLRGIVGRLQTRIADALIGRRARSRTLRTTALVITIAGLVIGLLGVLGMFAYLRQVARRIEAARIDAHRLGVGERLRHAPASGDEIGRLMAELYQTSDLLSSRTQDLVRAHRAALAAADDKDAFLSHLAHEIRTPLTALLGFGQLVETSDELVPGDAAKVAQMMLAGRHLLALAADFRELRDDTSSFVPEGTPTSIATIGQEVCELMAPIAAENQVTLELDVSAQAAVQADRRRLSQVLINLVSNAIKYNRRGGTVRIDSHPASGDRFRLQVSDTGFGISEELQPRVFAPFERLDASDGDVEGSGIGLALSRAYVEAMGGAIGVDSVPDQGATFWIELPIASAPVDAWVAA
jgi:signal transduction histidine kinase